MPWTKRILPWPQLPYPTPVPVPGPTSHPHTVAHFHLTHEEAMSLVDNIANALEVNHEDTSAVLPPYPEEACTTEGVGL
jgi:hypothetical protein